MNKIIITNSSKFFKNNEYEKRFIINLSGYNEVDKIKMSIKINKEFNIYNIESISDYSINLFLTGGNIICTKEHLNREVHIMKNKILHVCAGFDFDSLEYVNTLK